jgi:uncharacterized protein YyaL (SSP411 family)
MPNRLAQESSPYLLQHADNPVDWYPYGEEAFDRARREDRPILLSIGYSACHWCHVMAHESFEDPTTAELMNERFIAVKVDREEMPDVDQIYQQALQLQGESGGWPLTMALTPEGVPFFGGTYFPKEDRFGRPSFKRLLTALSDAYRKQPDAVAENARQYRDGLRRIQSAVRTRGHTPLTEEMLLAAAATLASRVDRIEGGFAGAPKFPNPTALELLLRVARRAKRRGENSDHSELMDAVTCTLTKMADGGIHDQVGGGFHRYSTDEVWLVPHFEKMLYDNAQLLRLYAEGYQVTHDLRYAEVARAIGRYLEREMRSKAGGLFTAQDADSEGHEGKYFVWTLEQLAEALGPEEAAWVSNRYGVTPEGNFRDPHGHAPPGGSILHRSVTPKDENEETRLRIASQRLLAARQRRVAPGMDDKILASSNGLAITGLAEAGRILGDAELIQGARRTADFVLAELLDEKGRLYRTWSAAGGPRLPGTLDDHANVASGLIALYEATFEARYLTEAHRLTALSLGLFYDENQHAFYLTAAEDPLLIERPVSLYDSAVPSGMSTTICNLIRLGDAFGEPSWIEIAEAVLEAHMAPAVANPFGFSHLLSALDLYLEQPTEIVLAGPRLDPLSDPLVRAVASIYLPNRIILRAEEAPAGVARFLQGKQSSTGHTTAFVCRQFTCEQPETDPTTLMQQLTQMKTQAME